MLRYLDKMGSRMNEKRARRICSLLNKIVQIRPIRELGSLVRCLRALSFAFLNHARLSEGGHAMKQEQQ